MWAFIFLTVLSVILGAVVMGIGGETDKKFSRKLMIMRVSMQAISLVLIALNINNMHH